MKIKLFDYSSSIKALYTYYKWNFEHPPKDLDYDIANLYKKQTFLYGDIVEIIYYGEFDPATKDYTVPVIRETMQYFYQNGLPFKRILTIAWYYDDGTLCEDTKQKIKYYNEIDAMLALKSKRSNIVASTKMDLVKWLLGSGSVGDVQTAMSMAKIYMANIIDGIKLFEDGNASVLNELITNDVTNIWLDNVVAQTNKTIRQLLLSQVNYPVS